MKMVVKYFISALVEVVSTITSVPNLRQVWFAPLHRNSLYLMLNSGVTAGLGFVFWLVAARVYSTEEVGLSSALISAVTLLAFIASLGLSYGLIRFLPEVGERRQGMINSCLNLVALVSLVASLIFLVGLPLWSPAFLVIRSKFASVAAFVGFVIAWGLYSTLTNIFVSFRRAEYTLASGVVCSLLKVAGVATLGLWFGDLGIFASWGIATLFALVIGFWWFLPRLLPGYSPQLTLQKQVSNEMLHYSFANYISSTLWNAPQLILPIMIVNLLNTAANAYFFIAWSVASLLLAIPLATSTSLFAEGSYKMESAGQDLLRSLKLTVVLFLPSVLLTLALSNRVLLLFGREYASSGTGLLWLLAWAALPASINLLYIGAARVLKRLKDILLIAGGVAVGTLVSSYFLLPHLGTLGVGVGWLASQSLVAMVLIPKIRRLIRKP